MGTKHRCITWTLVKNTWMKIVSKECPLVKVKSKRDWITIKILNKKNEKTKITMTVTLRGRRIRSRESSRLAVEKLSPKNYCSYYQVGKIWLDPFKSGFIAPLETKEIVGHYFYAILKLMSSKYTLLKIKEKVTIYFAWLILNLIMTSTRIFKSSL